MGKPRKVLWPAFGAGASGCDAPLHATRRTSATMTNKSDFDVDMITSM
jgi:hypothetical protein